MDDVIRVEHPQGRTLIPKQLRQVLLCQKLEGESAKARHEAPVPSCGIDLREEVEARKST